MTCTSVDWCFSDWLWQSVQLRIQKNLWQWVEAADKMAVMNFSETAAAPEVGLKHANLQHPIIFVLLWLFKRVDFYLCYAPPVLSWARHRYFHSFPHPPPPCLFPPILIAPCHSCSMPCLTCLRAAVTKIQKRRRILHGFSLGPGTQWCTVWVCMCLSVLVVLWALPLTVHKHI